MRLPHGRELLNLMDSASAFGTTERAIHLLATCDPDLSAEHVAALDVGRFEARLLDLCEALLGRTMAARAYCPHCRTALDLELDTGSLRQPAAASEDRFFVEHAGVMARFRLPTVRDLAAIERESDAEAARVELLRRCITALDGADAPDAPLLDAISDALGDLVPQADIVLTLDCVACGHQWNSPLDLGAFLWRDLAYRAELLLQDVHVLASAYHWSEAAILAMPSTRRRRYLDKIEA